MLQEGNTEKAKREKRMNEKTESDIMDAIAIRTFGESMTRKQLRTYAEKCYGEKGNIILSKMWLNRYLAVNSYNEVTVTGRWAEYSIAKRQSVECVQSDRNKEMNIHE